jgi:hypothetical protein
MIGALCVDKYNIVYTLGGMVAGMDGGAREDNGILFVQLGWAQLRRPTVPTKQQDG